MKSKDTAIFCDYCQSFPTEYICHHPKMIVREGKNVYFRECVHVYTLFDRDWKLFPCPFMDGYALVGNKKIKIEEGRIKNDSFEAIN